MNDTQEKCINDYIRWGLTKEQAEAWIIHGLYPSYDLMKEVRRKRWDEKDQETLTDNIDILWRMLEEDERLQSRKTIKIYKLVKFDQVINKNGNFYEDREYFTKEQALEAKKQADDSWEQYCNSSEENKKRAYEYGPLTIKIVSFEVESEDN